GEAQRSEQVFQDSGLEWTIVRAGWFDQNFSEGFLLGPVLGGEVALPVGDVPEPFIDADDIADVVVAVLTEEGHAGQVYELTGPRLLTFAEAVAEIAIASGRDVRFVQLSVEQYNSGLKAAQVPDTVVRLLNYLFTTVLDGRNAYLTDGVQRVLGRKPRDFAEYARATAATGVWTV
ncbi:MAG: NAD(P)H-binding protein, partial [Chloroflexi bacterium]|nr:NAD(P)H-binding protein [Chloroflexota bacterium]